MYAKYPIRSFNRQNMKIALMRVAAVFQIKYLFVSFFPVLQIFQCDPMDLKSTRQCIGYFSITFLETLSWFSLIIFYSALKLDVIHFTSRTLWIILSFSWTWWLTTFHIYNICVNWTSFRKFSVIQVARNALYVEYCKCLILTYKSKTNLIHHSYSR